MNPTPSSSAKDGRPVMMTRWRARLGGEGNPEGNYYSLDPNAPRGPRDWTEEEVMVKIEVKKEPEEEVGSESQVATNQEYEPERKRVKGEMIVVEEEIDLPMEFMNLNDDQEQGMELANDDEGSPEVHETTTPKIDYVVPVPLELDDVVQPETDDVGVEPPETDDVDVVPLETDDVEVVPPETDDVNVVPPETDDVDVVLPETDDVDVVLPETDDVDVVLPETDDVDVVPPEVNDMISSASDLLANCLLKEYALGIISNVIAATKKHTIKPTPTTTGHGQTTASPVPPEDSSASCQTGSDGGDHFTSQTPTLGLITKVFEEMSKLSGLVEALSMKSETAPTDGDLSTATPAPSEDGIASTSATCQTGSADGDDDGFQTKIVELFPEVIKVFWEKYARLQPNGGDLLNAKSCRVACKTWKEGIDEVLQGEYTPLKRKIYPAVVIPNGDHEKTIQIVEKVLEAYEDVDLSVYPFPPRVLEIKDQNTDSTVQQISVSRNAILAFIKKFGSGLKVFKHYGILGTNAFYYQYTSDFDWFFTVIRDWIGRMPNLEKLTLRNSFVKGVPNRDAEIRKIVLSCELKSYSPVFPKLEKLKSLEEDLTPPSVIAAALRANNLVTHVHCYSNCINKRSQGLMEGVSFPMLQSLSYADEYLFFESDSKSMFKAVEKLELDNSPPYPLYLDLEGAFRFVQNFNEKLKTVHFKFPKYTHRLRTENDIDRLVMPKLKELSMTFYQGDEDEQQFFRFKWTEDIIVEMCSDLNSLEKLQLFGYRIEEIKWEENVRELKMCQIKKLLRTRLVNRLMEMLPNLKLVEIQPAMSGKVMKSLFFIRVASME